MSHSIETIASTRKKTKESIRVESLLPSELREKSTALIDLLKDYYTHLNEKDQSSYVINSINNQRDIDLSESRIGKIDRIAVITGGSGYTTNPVVTINGDGTGAIAIATVRNGTITGINLVNAGLGYTNATVVITDSTGINASAQATVSNVSYLDLIQKEIAISIPKNLITNQVTLYKNLMRYYSLRGSQESIQLFFKILFNDNVEVYYPKDSILRPSSGTWDTNFKSSANVSALNQSKYNTFQIQLTPGSSGTADYSIEEKIIGLTTGAETIVKAIDGNILTVSGILNGNDQFEKSETVIGETTLSCGNYIAGEHVYGIISTSTAIIDAVDNDQIIMLDTFSTPTGGTAFQIGELLVADPTYSGNSGTRRKINSIEENYVLQFETFSVSEIVEGSVSGATGTIQNVLNNQIQVTYNSVNSKNAPTPGFFQIGEIIFAAGTGGGSGIAAPITSINNKAVFTVTTGGGALFTVNKIVSGRNSGAKGVIQTIVGDQINLTSVTGAFRNGETLVLDTNPSVSSTITNTPVITAVIVYKEFSVGDAITSENGSAIIVAVNNNSATVGYATEEFNNSINLVVNAANGISRWVNSITKLLRLTLSNFQVGEILSSTGITGKVISVANNIIKLQNVTGTGAFETGDDVYGITTNTTRRLSAVTNGIERNIAAIFQNNEIALKIEIALSTGTFTVGEIVTGNVSGEFAKVISHTNGVLSVTNPSGNFTRNETLTGSVSLKTANVVRIYTRGAYTSTLGFLDDSIKLQDSYFYQQFSYVIRTGNNVDIWKDAFNRLVHPSGFKFFGEILLILELLNSRSVMPLLQPGMIYDEDIPLLILLDNLLNTATLAASVIRIALDVPTVDNVNNMLKYYDSNPMSIYDIMTIQQADGFSQETPTVSKYAWDDYTVANVINNEITWNDAILGANLT